MSVGLICLSFHRAKKAQDENLSVVQTWSEFNAMLDKNKVCAETNFPSFWSKNNWDESSLRLRTTDSRKISKIQSNE